MTAPDTARFAAARVWAATKVPYLASALFACAPVAAPGSGTIAVDRGWRVHADPDAVARLEADELGRLLVHLAGHLVRDHADRAEAVRVSVERRAWWDRCADAEINDDLAAAGLVPPVARDLPADLGAPDHELVESYFAREDTAQSDACWDCGSGADGAPRPWDGEGPWRGLDADQAARLRHAVAGDIRQAEQHEPGSVPGGWLRWADTVLRSRTDWRRTLAAEIRRAVASIAGSVDYTYRRPSRRSHTPASAQHQVVLPSLHRPVPEVAVVCDTSGSMDGGLLARVLSEVDAILASTGLRAAGMATSSVDTEVHARRRVRRATEVELAGGGGTDMGAGIAAAALQRPRPELIVVLTDGFTPWPPEPPRGIRVVVGLLETDDVTPDDPPPWAKVVRITSH